MPTYQYTCTSADCGAEFELVQSFTDAAPSECPTCHGPVRKVFSAVGVVFKGSGFYRTDSRAGNGALAGAHAKHEHGNGSSGSSSSSSSSDSSGSSSSSSSPSSSSSDSSSSSSSSSTAAKASTPAA